MNTIEQTIDVAVPVSTAYNQWTQFESFPAFMDGVETVKQVDDTHLLWVVDVGGERREWRAEIIEQMPDRMVAWRAVDGKENGGTVMFEPIDSGTTRISVRMAWEPDGTKEKLGALVGIDDARVKGDLKRFRDLIEERGVESGGWRGEVHDGQIERDVPGDSLIP